MVTVGSIAVLIAFVAAVVALACMAAGLPRRKDERTVGIPVRIGQACVFITFAVLTCCCVILIACFLLEDASIPYVVAHQSTTGGSIGWLYHVAGLWAGEQGSLLVLVWALSGCATLICAVHFRHPERLDCAALLVLCAVMAVLVVPMLLGFSSPFYAEATGAANAGMGAELEHWAMALHPPATLIAYALCCVPASYAFAALICGEASSAWAARSHRYALVGWLLLTAGIALGAYWSYSMVGWGGYWAWDLVEDASLLPWLGGLALLHTAGIRRRGGQFKRLSIAIACLLACAVFAASYVARGDFSSVHTFSGGSFSALVFLVLLIAALVLAVIGLIVRWRRLKSDADVAEAASPRLLVMGSLLDILLLIAAAVLVVLICVQISTDVSSQTFEAVARPLGILLLALLALAPLFRRRRRGEGSSRGPLIAGGICALIVFALLMLAFFFELLPAYQAAVQAGDETSALLVAEGPAVYYNGLAILGFLVASVLFGTAIVSAVRTFGHVGGVSLSSIGGILVHMSMAFVLVGLIGSSMYGTELNTSLTAGGQDDPGTSCEVGDYTLAYAGAGMASTGNRSDRNTGQATSRDVLQVEIYRDGTYRTTITPYVETVEDSQSAKVVPVIRPSWTDELVVFYNGLRTDGGFSLSVRVSPLIDYLWFGLTLLLFGGLLCFIGSFRRRMPAGVGNSETAR
ncbi:MAG: cytochrome c biogenesis protein CcsA [Coriobacteriaceae bacterium]|nr:cytochrome c biogenesis protein CcsA [Coriobacteriaceae bacterium]